jgi:hypothetical protein
MLVASVAFIRIAYGLRIPLGPNRYASPPLGVALVFSGFAMLGTSLVLLLKSPFRMPPGERVFRLLWLGPIGRGFVRLSMRGVKTSGGANVRSRPAAVAVASPVAATPPVRVAGDPVALLDARVAELERWRRSRGE